MAGTSTITLQLNSAAEILNDHPADPDAGGSLLRSCLEELLASVRDTPAGHDLNIILRLPPEEIEGDMPESIRSALAAQCAERIETYEGMMSETREKAISRLVTSLFIVVAAVAVFVILIFTLTSLDFLRAALGGVLAMGAWVILRNPITTYLRHWRPFKQEIANCHRIMAATVEVEAMSRDF